MFCRAASVFVLATLASCVTAHTSHNQHVDNLRMPQAAYGRKLAVHDTSHDGRRHFGSMTGERRGIQQRQEAPQINEHNNQQTLSGHGNAGQASTRANHYGAPLNGRHDTLIYRQNRHAPLLGQLKQLDETIKPRAEQEDYKTDDDRLSSKRQVDQSLGHVLNKDNNYGAPSNSRQHRNVPEFGELQEPGASAAANGNIDGKLGHVLNKENHYGMPLSGETQPAALTAPGESRASAQHALKDAASSAERRRTFWKLLPDKMYKHRVHRSV